MSATLTITACYAFVPFPKEALQRLHDELTELGESLGMTGLVLIAEEGLNATVSGTHDAIASWKQHVIDLCGPVVFKDSISDRKAFNRWSVKIKPEIVALKQEGIVPNGKRRHLSPEEWKRTIEEEDVIVLDTRNTYETAIGKFSNALDPQIQSFHEFPAFVQHCTIPKDKKVLMYCTGGIRCEKALLAMEKQGYDNVYQLDGGILAYLAQFPQQQFRGECFVFDHRVAVDQTLAPSQTFGLCPHCGFAAAESIRCHCGKEQKVCSSCMADESQRTCSKRCANDVRFSIVKKLTNTKK